MRPDGMISLPLLNDVQAAGLTPEQLRDRGDRGGEAVHRGSRRHHHRQDDQQPEGVHHRPGGASPGPYPLTAPTTVLQLISMAGGLTEFAEAEGHHGDAHGERQARALPVQLQGRRQAART